MIPRLQNYRAVTCSLIHNVYGSEIKQTERKRLITTLLLKLFQIVTINEIVARQLLEDW